MWRTDAPRWMHRGRCRGADPQIFDGDPLYEETAKAYCRRCVVRTECLEYSLEHITMVVGVWGGLNDDERRAQRRGGARRLCPGCRGERCFSDGYFQICISCGLAWQL